MIIKYRDEINIQKFSSNFLPKNVLIKPTDSFRTFEKSKRYLNFSLRTVFLTNLHGVKFKKKKFTSNLWIRAERRISSNYHLHRNAFTPVTFPVKRGRLTRVDYFQGRPLPAGVSLTLLLLREGEKDAGI